MTFIPSIFLPKALYCLQSFSPCQNEYSTDVMSGIFTPLPKIAVKNLQDYIINSYQTENLLFGLR